MLSSEKLVAFVSTTNADHARAFYRDKLGLRLVSEDGFALVFESNGAPLRVALAKEIKPAQYTVLGWDVRISAPPSSTSKKPASPAKSSASSNRTTSASGPPPTATKSPGSRIPTAILSASPNMPDANCKICGGTGWKIVERAGLSGAERCECSYATRNQAIKENRASRRTTSRRR